MKYLALVVLITVIFSSVAVASDLEEVGKSILFGFVARSIDRATRPKQQPAAQAVRFDGLGAVAIEVRDSWQWDDRQLGDELAGRLADCGFQAMVQDRYDDDEALRLSRIAPFFIRVTLMQGDGRRGREGGWTGRYSAERQTEEVWARAVLQVCRGGVVIFSVDEEASDRGGSFSAQSRGWSSGARYESEKPVREDLAIRNVLARVAAVAAARVAGGQSGTSQPAACRPPSQAQGIFCASCGQAAPPTANFCSHCGAKLPGPGAPEYDPAN